MEKSRQVSRVTSSGCCLFAIVAALVLFAGSAAASGPQAVSPRSGSPSLIASPGAAFWSQPPDMNGSKISSEYVAEYGLVSEVANDFVSSSAVKVTRVSWWGGPYKWEEGVPEPTFFNIHFYDDASCTPGNEIGSYFDIEPVITQAGTDGLGYPVYKYDAYVIFNAAAGATYWVSVQAYYHTFPPQWGWLEADGQAGCAAMFRSDYFGHPDWTPANQIAGSPWDASLEVDTEPPVEACCYTGGLCQILPAQNCTDAGGTPQGPDTECEPNPCLAAAEACCFEGTCLLIAPESCLSFGGTPQGPGSVCEPNPCAPVDQVACCFFTGDCTMLSDSTCTNFGGSPQGPGSVCDPNPCTPTGEACCFTDGSCIVLPIDTCTALGGQPHGSGTVCDPNPCPQPPPEACCFEDGHCEMQTPIACGTAGGQHMGTGTNCDPNLCPPPQPEACCFADAHCEMQMREACNTLGGISGGAGTVCEPNPCPDVIPTRPMSWGQIKALYR